MSRTQFKRALTALGNAAEKLEGAIDGDDFYDYADDVADAKKILDDIADNLRSHAGLFARLADRVPPRESENWPQIQAAWKYWSLGDWDQNAAREIGNDFGYPTREILDAVDSARPPSSSYPA